MSLSSLQSFYLFHPYSIATSQRQVDTRLETFGFLYIPQIDDKLYKKAEMALRQVRASVFHALHEAIELLTY